MMNSAADPVVMQFLAVESAEQSGSALTDQHGLPVGEVQLRTAPVFKSCRKVQP